MDLSIDEVQGRYGHDKIDMLLTPGIYKLPFKVYKDRYGDVIKNIKVNVVSVFSCAHFQQCIVVFDGDFFWTFYYNGIEKCFKPNWENANINDIYDWINLDNGYDEISKI